MSDCPSSLLIQLQMSYWQVEATLFSCYVKFALSLSLFSLSSNSLFQHIIFNIQAEKQVLMEWVMSLNSFLKNCHTWIISKVSFLRNFLWKENRHTTVFYESTMAKSSLASAPAWLLPMATWSYSLCGDAILMVPCVVRKWSRSLYRSKTRTVATAGGEGAAK